MHYGGRKNRSDKVSHYFILELMTCTIENDELADTAFAYLVGASKECVDFNLRYWWGASSLCTILTCSV